MNRELEALRIIKIKCRPNSNPSPLVDDALNVVEEAVIKYIKHKKLNSDLINKAEAFELIISKNVDVNQIRPNAKAKDYNSKMPYYRPSLTDDEFKFLKETIWQYDMQKYEENDYE